MPHPCTRVIFFFFFFFAALFHIFHHKYAKPQFQECHTYVAGFAKQCTYKEVVQSFRTVVRRLPLICPGADCWLAGRCDDSRLAESRKLRAEAQACGRALLE